MTIPNNNNNIDDDDDDDDDGVNGVSDLICFGL